MMKDTICVAVGLVGSFFTAIFGGWDSALVTLVVFMAIDFFTGIITAMMKKSKHTESGGLSSKAGWFGLAKKVCTLMLIVVAVRNADRRCSSDGYSAEYQLHPGCCLHQLLPERTAFHRRKYIAHGDSISACNQKSN